MPDELFSDTGPEANNQDAARFEDQLIAMSVELGWTTVARNIDVYLEDGEQRAGIDVLWALTNPRTGRGEGWIGEGKRHDGPGRYITSTFASELHRLREKIVRLDSGRTYDHPVVGKYVTRIAGGVLLHHSRDYNAAKALKALSDVELRGTERGPHPTRIAYVGPDTLCALADAFDRLGAPAVFLWPPTPTHPMQWHGACSPSQLAAGVLIYRTEEGKSVLWVRGALDQPDVDGIVEMAWRLGVDFDHVVASALTQERGRVIGDAWELGRVQAQGRQHGAIPRSPLALDITGDNMREFEKRWHASP